MIIGNNQKLVIIFPDNNTAACSLLLLLHVLSPEIGSGYDHLVGYGNNRGHSVFHHLCHIRHNCA